MPSSILRNVNNNIGSANTGTVSIQGSSETVVMLSYDPTTSSWKNYNPNYNMQTLIDNIECQPGETTYQSIYVKLHNPSIAAYAVYTTNDISMVTVDSYQRIDEAIVDTSANPSVINYIWIPIVSIMSIGIFVMGTMIVAIVILIIRRRKRRTTSAPNTSSNAKPITRTVTPSPSTDKKHHRRRIFRRMRAPPPNTLSNALSTAKKHHRRRITRRPARKTVVANDI